MTSSHFGSVDLDSDHFILHAEANGCCTLTLVARADRGFQRRQLASLPSGLWRKILPQVARELQFGMDEREKENGHLSLRAQETFLSPLIGRELAILWWALAEDGEGTHTEALVAGWRQLAREERWWLYVRASGTAQQQGKGWRRALFYALTDPADTRNRPQLLELAEAVVAQKKMTYQPPSVGSSAPRHPAEKQPSPRQPHYPQKLAKQNGIPLKPLKEHRVDANGQKAKAAIS